MKTSNNHLESALKSAYEEKEKNFPFSILREILRIEENNMFSDDERDVLREIRNTVNSYFKSEELND